MKRLFSSFYFIVAFCYIFMSQGCALVFHTRKCALVTQQDSTKVQLVEGGGGIWSSGTYSQNAEMREKVGEVTLDNRNEYYLVEQSKKGYLSNTTMIEREKFNTTKGIDILIPFICDLYLLSGAGAADENTNNGTGNSSSTGFNTGRIVAWTLGTAGWLDLAFGPWKMYNKTYTLPQLDQIPLRQANETRIYVKDAGVDIKKDSLVRTYYSTYKDFKKKQLLYTTSEKESFKYSNTEFQDSLNHSLSKWGYIDTSSGLFSRMYNSAYYIKCNIYSMTINTVNSITFVGLKCNWMLYGTTDEQAIYKTTISSTSTWGEFTEDADGYGSFIGNALKRGMVEFINTDEVQKYLHNQSAVKNTTDQWKTIDFSGSQQVNNLQDAIKSVVTIKVPDGHGSGCIVSQDGYLITNYHVISEDTSNTVQVITNDGDTLKADYVRSNSEYDLALLKIEKPQSFSYFVPTLSKDIGVGSEVYAIGTPEDISLGQTITKGIISGKRKVHGKTVIQTDVSINPGNSGGALVNKDGILLGIVCAKLMGEDVQGIGFAIPSNYIEDALKVKFVNSK